MSIFHRKRPGSLGSGADSLPSREALTTPHPATRHAPAREPRLPKREIGLSRLLEVYDAYEHLVEVLDETEANLQLAEERATEADRQRGVVMTELEEERQGREADRVTAKEEKRKAEAAVDKKVRAELDPKIATLETKLKAAETERDRLKKELTERVSGMSTWINKMEAMEKQRAEADARERKAAEERKKLDDELRELNGTVLKGMREWVKPPAETEAKVDGKV